MPTQIQILTTIFFRYSCCHLVGWLVDARAMPIRPPLIDWPCLNRFPNLMVIYLYLLMFLLYIFLFAFVLSSTIIYSVRLSLLRKRLCQHHTSMKWFIRQSSHMIWFSFNVLKEHKNRCWNELKKNLLQNTQTNFIALGQILRCFFICCWFKCMWFNMEVNWSTCYSTFYFNTFRFYMKIGEKTFVAWKLRYYNL